MIKSRAFCFAAMFGALTYGGMSAAEAQSTTGLSTPPLQYPQIQPPQVPQYGVVPPTNLNPLPQNSFSDRATQCLQIGASAGLPSGSNGLFASGC